MLETSGNLQRSFAPAPPGRPLSLVTWRDGDAAGGVGSTGSSGSGGGGRFVAGEEALAVLRELKGEVGIVAVCGLPGTGKSYVLNQLLGRNDGFVVKQERNEYDEERRNEDDKEPMNEADKGPMNEAEKDPMNEGDGAGKSEAEEGQAGAPAEGGEAEGAGKCGRARESDGGKEGRARKGMWMWSSPVSLKMEDGETLSVLLLDTEGSDDETGMDATIFALALQLSSLLIYNQHGPIDERALDKLSLLAGVLRQLQEASASEEGRGCSTTSFAPSLIWLLRDFDDDAWDMASNLSMSLDNHFQNVLHPGLGDSTQDAVISAIRALFPTLDFGVLVRPVADSGLLGRLAHMPTESLSKRFLEGLQAFFDRVGGCTKPKTLFGAPITGPVLAKILEACVDTVNKGRLPLLPSMRPLVESWMHGSAYETAVRVLRVELTLPQTEADVEALHDRALARAESVYKTFSTKDAAARAAWSSRLRSVAEVQAAHTSDLLRQQREHAAMAEQMQKRLLLQQAQHEQQMSEAEATLGREKTKWQRLERVLRTRATELEAQMQTAVSHAVADVEHKCQTEAAEAERREMELKLKLAEERVVVAEKETEWTKREAELRRELAEERRKKEEAETVWAKREEELEAALAAAVQEAAVTMAEEARGATAAAASAAAAAAERERAAAAEEAWRREREQLEVQLQRLRDELAAKNNEIQTKAVQSEWTDREMRRDHGEDGCEIHLDSPTSSIGSRSGGESGMFGSRLIHSQGPSPTSSTSSTPKAKHQRGISFSGRMFNQSHSKELVTTTASTLHLLEVCDDDVARMSCLPPLARPFAHGDGKTMRKLGLKFGGRSMRDPALAKPNPVTAAWRADSP